MSQITDKVKEQLDELTKQLNRVDAAGRGLIVKVSEEGSRQLEELAKEGETQLESGNTLTEQVKSIVKYNGDAKELVGTLKLAALGLYEKVRSESKKIIDDLVKAVDETNPPKAAKPKAVKKVSKSAKAA